MVPRDLVFPFSVIPSACWPNLLFKWLHVLAWVSSECAVRISSQSLDLVVEYDNAVTWECLSEISGTENVVAFLVREPRTVWVTKRGFRSRLEIYANLGTVRMTVSHARQMYIGDYDLSML
jgi:hypothetical protein